MPEAVAVAVRFCRTYCDESGAPEWPQTKARRPTTRDRREVAPDAHHLDARRDAQQHNMPRLRPPPAPPRAHGVIVYLTQVRHSTYANKDSLGLLRGSLASLAKHYLEVHRDDTLLLHTGDFDEPSLQRLVLAPFTALPISFVRLPEKYWSLPPWLNETLGPVAPQMRLGKWVDYPFFSVGYRHMIRFYTIGLWDFCHERGYDWVMRLDEESRLHSPIPYHIFSHLRDRGLHYAYRQVSYESGRSGERFHHFVRAYLLEHRVRPKWLLDGCWPSFGVPPTAETAGGAAAAEAQWQQALQNYSRQTCGQLYGYYNNFLVTSVSFWRRPDVQRYLRAIDRKALIYTHRMNDILWQSSATQIFLERTEVALLDDFSYEHATTENAEQPLGDGLGCVTYGGLALARNDPDNQRATDYAKRFCSFADDCITKGSVASGTVVVEQPDCTRQPPNYQCDPSLRRHFLAHQYSGHLNGFFRAHSCNHPPGWDQQRYTVGRAAHKNRTAAALALRLQSIARTAT